MFMAGVGFRKPMALRGYGGEDCTKDWSLAALLGEDYHSHRGRLCVSGSIQAERNRAFGEVLQTSNPLQGADDACVLETAAAIFAATDLGRIRRIDEGGVEVCVWLSRCWVGGRNGGGDLVAVHGWTSERQFELNRLRSVLDGPIRVGRVVADELIGAVDDHLRGIDFGAETCAVFRLPVGVLVGRETVVPAEVVPVVHMLAQDDDFSTSDGLILVEFCQEGIGRRAARTPLRGEQLHQNGIATCRAGLGCADIACDEDSRQRCDERNCAKRRHGADLCGIRARWWL